MSLYIKFITQFSSFIFSVKELNISTFKLGLILFLYFVISPYSVYHMN
jgi:hypothetical protein